MLLQTCSRRQVHTTILSARMTDLVWYSGKWYLAKLMQLEKAVALGGIATASSVLNATVGATDGYVEEKVVALGGIAASSVTQCYCRCCLAGASDGYVEEKAVARAGIAAASSVTQCCCLAGTAEGIAVARAADPGATKRKIAPATRVPGRRITRSGHTPLAKKPKTVSRKEADPEVSVSELDFLIPSSAYLWGNTVMVGDVAESAQVVRVKDGACNPCQIGSGETDVNLTSNYLR